MNGLPLYGWPTRGGAVFADDSPNRGRFPPSRTWGITALPTSGGHRGLVVGVFDCGPTGRRFESAPFRSTFPFPHAVVHDRVNDRVSRLCATGHIRDPVPLIQKSRASCLGGRLPPSFIHQVILITGLNKLYDSMFSPGR